MLNTEQTAVVKNAIGNGAPMNLVVAGAGSGKTRVLIGWIKELLKGDVSPYEVMAFTFTRKAATEMKERLESEVPRSHAVTVGTMHSIALDYITKYYQTLVGRHTHSPTVYGDWEEQFLLKHICTELGFYNGKSWKLPKRKIDAFFATYYNYGALPASSMDSDLWKVYTVFTARCRENNAMTYGALLMGFRELIPLIKDDVNFRYVLIDEVQDMNTLQWSLVHEMITQWGVRVLTVGDAGQAIYEWRGATPHQLNLFEKQGVPVHYLTYNYRNAPPIIEAANRLIKHNALQRNAMEMKPMRDELDGAIMPLGIGDTEDFGDYLVGSSTRIVNDDCAVLCRYRRPLVKLSRFLTKKGFKHHYVGKKETLVRSEPFRRWVAWLKLLVNPYDNFSFLLIKDMLKLSNEQYAMVRMRAAEMFTHHLGAYKDLFPESSFLEFLNLGEDTELSHALPGSTILCRNHIDHNVLDGDIYQFVHYYLENIDPTATVADFLTWVATYDLQDDIEDDPGCLQLMTIHAAKGLEFKTVFMLHMNEGFLPGRSDNLMEERRLCYVGFTRAKDNLYPVVRVKNPVSQFLYESDIYKKS